MKLAAAFITCIAAAIGFAWAAQASVAFRYFALAAFAIGLLYVIFRAPPAPTVAEALADRDALKREQIRLTDLWARAKREQWALHAQAKIAEDLAQVERRLEVYR